MPPNIASLSKLANDQQQQITQQQQQIDLQAKQIQDLQNQINKMEGKFIQIESAKAISSHVNKVLNDKIDELNQYSCRSCLIVDGLKSNELEKLPEKVCEEYNIPRSEFDAELDKFHPIGIPRDDNTQLAIVKFRTHSYRENIYKMRLMTSRIKFRVALTKK